MERKFYVEVVYDDDSSFGFTVSIEGSDQEVLAPLCWITRGTLMASKGQCSTCYNEEGFDVCSYRR